MPAPGIEVGSIRLDIFVAVRKTMGVEYEFVGGKENSAIMTFDAFCSRRVVSCRDKLSPAPPRTFVIDLKPLKLVMN